MPTFEKVPSREQRAIACNREGTRTMSDAVDVAPSLFLRPAKGLISFDSSGGHQELRNAAACGADRYYDAASVFDRLHRGRSALSFRHAAARKLQLERPRDTTNMSCGGTPEISHRLYMKVMRSGESAPRRITLKLAVQRALRAPRYPMKRRRFNLTSTAPPLHVSHDVIDTKVHGPPAWRPSSASSVRRDDSLTSESHVVPRSRPSSAASLRNTVEYQRRAESSLAGTTHRSTTTAPEDERNPLGAFMATKRSISKNLTFSKAPRITF
ncbi:Hypothetical protein, putative [Bodo saltans]|uniref:Uncharacterized protein n=1 Tax=Bodo saltans TaxID=75058 RepID=A0A0S4JQG3_BODSA|nr:Hypothetical protein, putative [Bodo saltans]|eukprot:CUG90756.1 Hypothetical protein, putative [Bodo saltans]